MSQADAEIDLEGDLTLPDDLGNIAVPMREATHLVINYSGATIEGKVDSPTTTFVVKHILGLSPADLSLHYHSSDSDALKIQGTFELPDLSGDSDNSDFKFGIKADLEGENYILVTPSHVNLKGDLILEHDFTFGVKNGNTDEPAFTLKDVHLRVDVDKNRLVGGADARVSTGFQRHSRARSAG